MNAAALKVGLESTSEQWSDTTNDLVQMGVGASVLAMNYVLTRPGVRKALGKVNAGIDNLRPASWVKTAGLAAALAVSSYQLAPNVQDVADDLYGPSSEEQVIDMGPLAGRSTSDLGALYLGKPRTSRVEFAPEMTVNFKDALDKMWKLKDSRSSYYSVDQMLDSDQLKNYGQRTATQLSLDEYVEAADIVAESVHDAVDWKKVQKMYNLTNRQTKLTEEVLDNIDGDELAAYALTELFPSQNGLYNANFMDALLQHAGREYVELIPALGDDYLSFGPYQFTQYALYNKDGELRGASKFQEALAERVIGGSVIDLKGNDHHEAAYMFAGNNLARLIGRLNNKQMDVLEAQYSSNMDDLVQFIATSHHAPSHGLTTAERWLDNGAKQDFSVSANNRILTYAKKSRENYEGLQQFLDR